MNKKRSTLKVFDIFTLAIGILAVFFGPALAYELSDYYPLENGNTWVYEAKYNGQIIYKDGKDQEVLKVKGTEAIGGVETKVMVSVLYESQCVAIDSEGVKQYKLWGWYGGDYELYDPPQMLYPNIEVGEVKEYPINKAVYTIQDQLDEDTRAIGTLTIKLDSIEDVEVKAGKFTGCLKYTSVYDVKRINQPVDEKITTISWLAPGVGLVKQSIALNEYNRDTNKEEKSVDEMELKSATVAGEPVQPNLAETTEALPEAIEGEDVSVE